jgi:hypothetical protein
MKKILALFAFLLLSCNVAMAEEGNKKDSLSPELKTQIEAIVSTHHKNMDVERSRFRSEIEKLLSGHPELLSRFKAHWDNRDNKIDDRRDRREDRRGRKD